MAGAPKSGPSMQPGSELPMPIYEYACPDCGHEFERLQRMSDDPVRLCPECH